ncbi:tRNA pseudouridine(38-40) synthase TruA [Sphingorhabdus lacus]|uniref:tRNA pseudouridine synthase A n=1 Tax=Sphingorhabdus lacus TaxID=392610 RepID=A0A6I6L788_9SPHN|nr:tRNA pseudouridine(38-40) synthase TruA [Sphingorhabdus lacus]QGY80534.1 tRNA pseudouridine(38-40) synthase TruA [Sphingorhabdus lacus]
MTRFALTIEFDGGPYMGWQWQDHGPSVQGAIEEAIFKTTGEKTLVYSAGRTDAGVHALGMRAHVDVQKLLPPFRLMGAINAHLRPHPIAILACEEVDPEWHARYTCIGRSYEYRILNRRAPLTLEKGRVWRIGPEMDADAMHEAAQLLVGLHDFTTFRSTACQSASPLKTLDRLNVRREGDHIIVEAAALSFLHHQVRSMVGCLAAVGLGRWTTQDLKAALAARNRSALAENAPPEGLYFVAARYP